MTYTQSILMTLKAELKENGLTYAQFAKRVNLSEVSVKRLFSQRSSIHLDKIEQFCDALGLDFYELIRKAKNKNSNKKQHLTIEQEKALDKDAKLLLYFYSLLAGNSPEKIISDYKMTASDSQRYLLTLDRLGLIFLGSENKFKILASPFVEWAVDGPLSKSYEANLREEFLKYKALGTDEWLLFRKAYLAKDSLKLIRKQIDDLLSRIKEYSEYDRSTQPDRCEPVTFLLAARNWIPSSVISHRRKRTPTS
ncbi:MAG: helix-turn-helix transcriptional regulator [Bdellovibrionales bacterium]|nr:helix-turn-helix transcriptional regulator [Bdellovibrionales bacterium]